MESPPNLDALRAMPPGLERVKAALAYIAAREEAIDKARQLHDEDIRALIKRHGLAETHRLTGWSVSTLKNIRGRVPRQR